MLKISKLHVGYRGAMRALRSVSLGVPAVPVVLVLGDNGAGATTLLRLASGTLDVMVRGARWRPPVAVPQSSLRRRAAAASLPLRAVETAGRGSVTYLADRYRDANGLTPRRPRGRADGDVAGRRRRVREPRSGPRPEPRRSASAARRAAERTRFMTEDVAPRLAVNLVTVRMTGRFALDAVVFAIQLRTISPLFVSSLFVSPLLVLPKPDAASLSSRRFRRRRLPHSGGRRLVRPRRRGRLGRPARALEPPRASVTVLKNYSGPVSMDHCYPAAPSASPAPRSLVLCPPGGHRIGRHRPGAPARFPDRPEWQSRWHGQRDRPGE
jgi:energy-coupling factor transporter ATP-binding protein EcfA2